MLNSAPTLEAEDENDLQSGSNTSHYRDIEKTLNDAASGSNQYLSANTAKRWYEETLVQQSPRSYFEQVIRKRMEKWEELRSDFDSVTEKMEKHGTPTGFKPLEPDRFWKLPSRERFAYIKAAKEALKNGESQIKEIDKHISECRSLYSHRLINRKTQIAYDKMWEELRVKRNLEYMSGNSRFLYEAISEAQDYEADFKRTLDQGIKQGWMNDQNKKEWMDRFNDDGVLEWDRKQWLKEKFPEYVTNWQKVAKDRSDVLALAKKFDLTQKQVPELADLLNDKAFFGQHYRTRVHKVGKVKALLLAKNKNQERFIGLVEKELESWSNAGWLHASKVGPWMRRVMESDDPEKFATTVLWPFKNNWQKARERFDAVTPELKKRKDVTRGFNQINANKFLLLDYDKRIAYLEEAESRLESDVNEEGPLAKLRLDIRHAMDTGDWEGAELLLEEARKIDVDDKAVRSMGRYLETHRTDKKEEDDENSDENVELKGMEALMNLRSIMLQLPPNMRTMTEKALNSANPNTLKRLWQCFYNRHWVMVHGYSTQQSERENAENEWHEEQTANRIANGHDWQFEHNIIKGETNKKEGVRGNCKKPQMLYTNRGGLTEMYRGIEQNADNAMFGYWTTIVDEEVPYDSLREAVTNHMYAIKQNARILRASGLLYSSHGIPFSRN